MAPIAFPVAFILYLTSSSFAQNVVRLVGGSNSNEGRVEVFYQNQWGTVCDDLWNDLVASVVCKQLNKGFGKVLPQGTYPPGSGKIWMDDVRCFGIESSIFDCLSQPYGQNDCQHSEDVSIQCLSIENITTTITTTITSTTIQTQSSNCQSPPNDIRLVGKTSGIGTVEIQNQGIWGTICDDYWDLQDAKVVCRQLCYNETYALPGANKQEIQENKTPVYVQQINCVGTEKNIKQCPKFSWSQGSCRLMEAASVTCVYQDNAADKALQAQLMCTDTKMTAFFSRLKDPNLETKHLKVGLNSNDTCNPVYNQNITSISITVLIDQCGITIQKNISHIIYHLILWYLPTETNKDIIKESTYRHTLSCSFQRQGKAKHGPWIPQTIAVTQKSVGNFIFAMEFYEQSTFSKKITTFPFPMTLGAWLNVAVSLKTSQDNLKLIVPSCWVTTSMDRKSDPKYALLLNKCPLDPTLSLVPLNQTMLGFRFQTFTFPNSSGPFYIHCDTFVCLLNEKNEQCDQSCGYKNGRRKRSDYSSRIRNTIYHVTSHPFMIDDKWVRIRTTKALGTLTTPKIILPRQLISEYTTLPQNTSISDQGNFISTESNEESMTLVTNNEYSTIYNYTDDITPSPTNSVKTRNEMFTESYEKEEMRNRTMSLVKNTTQFNSIESKKEWKDVAEFAKLTRNTINDNSSKAFGLKVSLNLHKLLLLLCVLLSFI